MADTGFPLKVQADAILIEPFYSPQVTAHCEVAH